MLVRSLQLLANRRLAIVLAVTIAPVKASAQQASQPAYDPGQIERRFDAVQTPSTRPRLSIPKFPRPAETKADTKPLFVLRHISITGATAISKERLTTAWQAYLGKKVSQADLAAIATEVSDIYRAAGFHLSRAIVPPQNINGGSIRIQVIEGSLSEVQLKGEGAEQFGVRQMLAALLTERPSKLPTLERQLLLINNLPGVRIEDTTLDEIGSGSGHFRLTLSLKTWHVYTSLGVDNLGSSAVGPWQSYATAAFNSYLTPGDTLAVNLSTTPADPRQLAFGRLSYDAPVGTDGFRVGASGVYSEVWPGDYRRAFRDNTKTEAFELRGSFSPVQSQRSALILTAALGISNVSENDAFGLIYSDHIRTATLTSDYRVQDAFGGTNYMTATWRQGLPIFGASQDNDAYTSHYGASDSFSALNVWITRYQKLTDSWSMKISGAAQVASGPLFLSQQFYLGGAAFGRGYSAAEISGDNGMAGSFEVRFDQKLKWNYVTGYQLYSFLDTGVAWNSGFRYTDGISLTSMGAGVRLFLPNDTYADIGVAVPLSYRAPDNPSRDVRVLFSLTSALKLCPARPTSRCF